MVLKFGEAGGGAAEEDGRKPFCDDCGAELLKLTQKESHKEYTHVSGGSPWQHAQVHLCTSCASRRWQQPKIDWNYESYFSPKLKLINFFRVRKVYFDELEAMTKNEELRADTPFWRKRLISLADPPTVALFLCGKRKLYRLVLAIIPNTHPEAVLGRPLSEQGRMDIPTETCIATYLGRKYDW